MKRAALIGSVVILACAVAYVAVYLTRSAERLRLKEAHALHQAALADSAEIDREMKTYWDRKNTPTKLRNDLLQLKNDELDSEIATLQGRRGNREKIAADLAIIQNDKLALSLLDPGAPALDPYQAEARIQEHNRRYPNEKMASIADINRGLDEFHAKANAVIENSDKKLRQARGQ
jgi:hypothetical protein